MDYVDDRIDSNLATLRSDHLMEAWVIAKKSSAEWADRLGRIEWHLQRHMEADGATEFVCEAGEAEIKTSTSYDYSKLTPILELVRVADLVDAGAYSEARTETQLVQIPATWSVTKLKRFARRGRDVQAVIEDAKVKGWPRLVVTAATPTEGPDAAR